MRRGKQFHKLIQREWLTTTKDGRPRPERFIKRLNSRNGRVDILVEELGEFVSIVEIKCTNWDKMRNKNVIRNMRRQIRQIWNYVDAELEIYGKQVCPGIIFPKLPRDPKRCEQIEAMFNKSGIQVIWHNESIDHLKLRVGLPPTAKLAGNGENQ